eukprot:CAMPEP_0114119404 /NCGR_PEP_ID=MMETSP0043_2-20121206/6099_1 /TAXON_ID=464988 /ORGANISM="Hemiselmis andersenii, Strain CCMP644" /LENGTH=81 /DNA_ID=CAMNT_0001211961 /DNA_START=237 /DNA_END=482 /DNA_ORIENTATION=-
MKANEGSAAESASSREQQPPVHTFPRLSPKILEMASSPQLPVQADPPTRASAAQVAPWCLDAPEGASQPHLQACGRHLHHR